MNTKATDSSNSSLPPDKTESAASVEKEAAEKKIANLKTDLRRVKILSALIILVLLDILLIDEISSLAVGILIGIFHILLLAVFLMNTKDTGSSHSFLPSDKTEAAAVEKEAVVRSIEEEITNLETELRRVKFLSALIILVLLDILLLDEISNWAVGLLIGIFQLILLLFIGKMLKIEDVDKLITKILNALGSSSSQDLSAGHSPDRHPPPD